ncbi:MAG TPA: hypothetical protein VNI52_04485 [Sphingobacteriaceae bacterium]|nr:hypothetical protein [Sphingobacteriaceae bacterium]
MKKLFFLPFVAVLFAQCGVKHQLTQLKAFEDCKYELVSADSMYVANINVKEMIEKKDMDLKKAPRLALALLRRNVPFDAKLNLQISNPSGVVAAISQFEYKILVRNRELASGFVNQNISVSPGGGKVIVPVRISSNIYHLLADDKTQRAIADFFAKEDNQNNKSLLTIKVRPTLDVANRKVNYPGFITIDKEITKKILL